MSDPVDNPHPCSETGACCNEENENESLFEIPGTILRVFGGYSPKDAGVEPN